MSIYGIIIHTQRQELQERLQQEQIIERDAFSSFQKLLSSSLVKVITGVRRCGKSILCAQLLKGKKYGYINFDDEKLTGIAPSELDKVLEAVYEVYGQIDFLFLDEVQNIDAWELFVNRLQRQGLNLIVTGSNAKLLSKELATHLTGRHIALELFPFSFREFLKYKKKGLRADTGEEMGLLKRELQEYLEKGGFPEILREPSPSTYLNSLYSTIITKDILMRHRIRFARTFRDLASYVITNFSQEVSYNKLKNIFNLGSDHTTKNYLHYLEETYLLFLIEKFSYKKKESLLENKKSYVIDTGMITAVGFQFSDSLSRFYENIVAVELLRKRAINIDQEIYYWKNAQQEEVDFVVKKKLKVTQLIQVSYSLREESTRKRELRALLKASKELYCNNLLVITSEQEGEETIEWFGIKGTIRYIPLWKWLLHEPELILTGDLS